MRRLSPALVAIVALISAGIAAASTSHTNFWQNPTHKVACGDMIGGKLVLCSSPKIPAPPHSNPHAGDPGFVSLGKTGKPQLLRLSQDSFVGTTPKTLSKGSTWSSRGVTCTIGAKSVTCKNKSNHGFEIYGPGKSYKSF
jgi:hypothetical protein